MLFLNRYAPNGKPISSDPMMGHDYDVRTVLDHPNMHTRLTVKRVAIDTAGAYRLVVKTKPKKGSKNKKGKKLQELVAEETLRLTVKAPATVC